MNFDDYRSVLDNSFVQLADGTEMKIESLKWKYGEQTATINGYIREVWTRNLKEEPVNV